MTPEEITAYRDSKYTMDRPALMSLVDRLLDIAEGEMPSCGICGDLLSDLLVCDECSVRFCEDCAPHRNDDAPVDVCLKCWKGPQ